MTAAERRSIFMGWGVYGSECGRAQADCKAYDVEYHVAHDVRAQEVALAQAKWACCAQRMPSMSRRRFLCTAGVAAAACSASRLWARSEPEIIGQGDFRYRRVPDWGVLDGHTPVNDGHGLAQDREGHIILLTNHTANNVIVYDRSGRLVHKWGTTFPGAHGLSLVSEGAREVLFITDLNTHRVVKTTLDGEILNEWRWPELSGKYAQE